MTEHTKQNVSEADCQKLRTFEQDVVVGIVDGKTFLRSDLLNTIESLRTALRNLCELRRRHKEIYEYEKCEYVIDEGEEWLAAKALLENK